MRVLIISDMEGVAGICRWGQVDAGEPLYEEGRRLYTGEINAAVRGAVAAGATEVIVMDHHGAGGDFSFNTLIAEELDPRCQWVVQREWTEYTGALEAGCDLALLIGMHAKVGTPDGVLNHTVSTRGWSDLRFNGVSVGETGINAAWCGAFGCPVALVTGDRATCREARALLGERLPVVETKLGLSSESAVMYPPARVRDEIEAASRAAVQAPAAVPLYDPGSPAEITVEFATTNEVERYRRQELIELMGPRTIVTRADDWWTAWRRFYEA